MVSSRTSGLNFCRWLGCSPSFGTRTAPVMCVATAQTVLADHVHRDVDVVRAGQVPGCADERVVVQDVEDAGDGLHDVVFAQFGLAIAVPPARSPRRRSRNRRPRAHPGLRRRRRRGSGRPVARRLVPCHRLGGSFGLAVSVVGGVGVGGVAVVRRAGCGSARLSRPALSCRPVRPGDLRGAGLGVGVAATRAVGLGVSAVVRLADWLPATVRGSRRSTRSCACPRCP